MSDRFEQRFMGGNLGLLLFHLLFSTLLFYLILNHLLDDTSLDDLALNAWDAGWYESIATHGYTYAPGEKSSVAFFSLFPLLWKGIGVDRLQIAGINLLLFLAGVWILARKWQFRPAECLLLVATPALFFCYVPYSEALFFLLSVLFLVGMKDRNFFLCLLSLLLAGMVRSVAFVFIPIFIFMTLLQGSEAPRSVNRTLGRNLIFSLVCIISLLLTFAIHRAYTGHWFGLFEAQKSWGRVLAVPLFPLRVNSTTSGFELFWLDGTAYLMGLVSGLFCLKWIIRKLQGNRVIKDDATLFSFAYLAMMFLITLLYSPADVYGTKIYSLSRLFFCGPFYMLLVLYFLRRRFSIQLVFVQIIVFILGMFSFSYIYSESLFDLVKMLVPMFLYFSFILTGYTTLQRPFLAALAVYAVLVSLQIYLLIDFMRLNWVS